MHGNIIAEGLAVVTTYTGASISMRGNFYCDRVIVNRRTQISRCCGGNFVRVRRP